MGQNDETVRVLSSSELLEIFLNFLENGVLCYIGSILDAFVLFFFIKVLANEIDAGIKDVAIMERHSICAWNVFSDARIT